MSKESGKTPLLAEDRTFTKIAKVQEEINTTQQQLLRNSLFFHCFDCNDS